MSRAEKVHRRNRRKQKHRNSLHGSIGELRNLDLHGRRLEFHSYAITHEPLERAEERNPQLDLALADIREELFDQTHNDPAAAIPRLQSLLERFPNQPMLLNWLSAAYGRAGDDENSERTCWLNYESNPDYLFAKLNYASIFLHRGDLKQVETILDRKFDLQGLYPDRDLFHVSEFVAMNHVAIQYWIHKGEFDAAKRLHDVLLEIAPDHAVTRHLTKLVDGSLLLDVVRKLAGSKPRRGELLG